MGAEDTTGAEIMTGAADMAVKDMAGAEATKEAETAIRSGGKEGRRAD